MNTCYFIGADIGMSIEKNGPGPRIEAASRCNRNCENNVKRGGRSRHDPNAGDQAPSALPVSGPSLNGCFIMRTGQ